MQVAIKFEHTTSKGLTSKGVPYEWEVYQQLGETPGVPRLLHKGMQDSFCVMVRDLLPGLMCSGRVLSSPCRATWLCSCLSQGPQQLGTAADHGAAGPEPVGRVQRANAQLPVRELRGLRGH